ncbi:MAG TPA: hypothetical protein VN089_10240 [Duganella sp.]|nr:hypothetical protein [Duganella sp.]
MISKSTRAKLIAQLKANGTLASTTAPSTLVKEAVKAPQTVAIASVMKRCADARGTRWLAPSAHQVMLP